MRGHIVERYPGSFSVVIYLGRDPDTDIPKYKWYTVKGDRSDAEKFLTKTLHQLDTNTYADPGKLTMAEYLRRWYRDYCELNLAHSSLVRTKSIIENHLIPYLGKHLIGKLQPLHIQEYYSWALKNGRIDNKAKVEDDEKVPDTTLSPTTVLYHHRVLHEALKHAVEWQIIIRNPADAVRPPRKSKPQLVTLDKPEVDVLLSEARGTELYIPILLAIHTGMRRGEILALQWKDIDFNTDTIMVRQALEWMSATKEHRIKRTKSEKNRRVDVARVAMAELESWKKEQKQLRVVAEKENKKRQKEGKSIKPVEINDYVCTWPNGHLVSLDYCTKEFIRLARRCRLGGVTFHGLRHTHATLMLQLNIHPKIVAERLGHADMKMFMEVYSHVMPSMQREAAQKWDDLF